MDGCGLSALILGVTLLLILVAIGWAVRGGSKTSSTRPNPDRNRELMDSLRPAASDIRARNAEHRDEPYVWEPEPGYVTPKPQAEEPVRCPNCGSSQITADRKGYGVGKAVGGVLIAGPVGLLGGFIGSRKVLITCLQCGKQWKPGA